MFRSRKTQPKPAPPFAAAAVHKAAPPQPFFSDSSSKVPIEAMRSCIKIYTNSVGPDYLRPWQKLDPESCTGSGFAIEGRYVLTNSHVVRHHQLLQVQRHDRPGKWVARLLAEGVQCDLALLAVDDESFWDDLPLQACTDDVPTLQHVVTAVGYPVGGENLSVTRGVVSRIDLLDYTFLESDSCRVAGERLLVLQIDAAINPGNSGGPVFNADGVVVGVAFAGLDEADNIGYVIPMPVVRLFLRAYGERGSFGQLPSLGLSFQHTENRSLRKHLQLEVGGRRGLLVTGAAPLMPASQSAGVRPGDVVVQLDGLDVAEDGTVQAMPGLRLPWDYCVTRHPVGTEVQIVLMRDGHEKKVAVPLVPEPRKVAFHDGVDAYPSYAIVGGLVFVELSIPLLDAGLLEWLHDPASVGKVLIHLAARRTQADERVVLLASILESELTISYEASCVGRQLTKFNGAPVRHVQALASAVANAGSAPFLRFEFEGDTCAVLETAQCRQTEADVLAAHDIASWCSVDVDPADDRAGLIGCLTAFSVGGRRGSKHQPLPPLS